MLLADQIRTALTSLSANDLQVLAEEMAKVSMPDRFTRSVMVSRGRNEYGQTRRGWPDAFVERQNGDMDVIEATRDKANWITHLESDLKKVRDKNNGTGKIVSFFFVGGYPKAPVAEAKIRELKKDFQSAGLPAEDITILVGRDLISALSDPKHVRVRFEILGISPTPEVFRLLYSSVTKSRHANLFEPTAEEYAKGLVHCPAISKAAVAQLRTTGSCLIRGVGAAGKTTLAHLISREIDFAPFPSWYLDLSGSHEGLTGAACRDIAIHKGSNVLFIVDNVHQDAPAAEAIVNYWRTHGLGAASKLLLLGRHTQRSGPPVSVAGLQPLTLRATVHDLPPIVARMFARRGLKPPVLDEDTLREWGATFGDKDADGNEDVDLIAFSDAVSARLQEMIEGDYALHASDCVDAVRGRYIAPLTIAGESRNIIRMIALSELEIPLPDTDLPNEDVGLSTSMDELGLVVLDSIGLEKRRAYAFRHANIGKLLLSAGMGQNVIDERLIAARTNVAMGLRIAAKTPKGPRQEALDQIVETEIREKNWTHRPTDIYDLSRVSRFAITRKILTAAEVDAHLVGSGILANALDRTRAIPNVRAFVAMARTFKLQQSLDCVDQHARGEIFPLFETCRKAKPADMCSLFAQLPSQKHLIATLDISKWRKRQELRPVTSAAHSYHAIAKFRSSNREDLAKVVAECLLLHDDGGAWADGRIDHLSHVLRLTSYMEPATSGLLRALDESCWLESAYDDVSIGSLCGALMSFANHLPSEYRARFLNESLRQRVLLAAGNPLPQRSEEAAKNICLVGGYFAMGGTLKNMDVKWSFLEHPLGWFLERWKPKTPTASLGMYELQFWLGVMALSRHGMPHLRVSSDDLAGFEARLCSSTHNSSRAEELKRLLLGWIELTPSKSDPTTVWISTT